MSRIPAITWAVLAFATWRSTELLNAWRHSPMDRFAWIAFLVWLSPAVVAVVRPPSDGGGGTTSGLLGASLAATLIGILADLNTAHYVGLAFAVSALVGSPWSWRHAFWIAAALAWMPALSWLGQGLPRPALILARILIAGVGMTPILSRLLASPTLRPKLE